MATNDPVHPKMIISTRMELGGSRFRGIHLCDILFSYKTVFFIVGHCKGYQNPGSKSAGKKLIKGACFTSVYAILNTNLLEI